MLKRLPIFKILAFAQLAMLARRHFQQLDPAERRRLMELIRHPRQIGKPERKELQALVGKLEPRAFAAGAADAFSPLPLPGRRRSGRR